jgi:hypothetical protein
MGVVDGCLSMYIKFGNGIEMEMQMQTQTELKGSSVM